jgi:hypothetical protein
MYKWINKYTVQVPPKSHRGDGSRYAAANRLIATGIFFVLTVTQTTNKPLENISKIYGKLFPTNYGSKYAVANYTYFFPKSLINTETESTL